MHAEKRSYHYVDVLVSHVRKKLGADVIVNERGRGYRLGRAVTKTNFAVLVVG